MFLCLNVFWQSIIIIMMRIKVLIIINLLLLLLLLFQTEEIKYNYVCIYIW